MFLMIRNLALFVLYNKEGKILMQHRTDDAPRFPGLWGFFGGGIEQGESPKQALLREIKEELNLVVSNPQLILTTDFKDDVYEGKRYVFKGQYYGEPLELLEGQAMKWCTVLELKALKVSPHKSYCR